MAVRPGALSGRNHPSVQFGSRTDIGCVRDHNEDSLVVAPPLYAVADGMGGHAAGEIASEIAVRTLAAYAPEAADTQVLGDAVVRANHDVIKASLEKGRTGMGTTMTATILQGERLAIAQVGDSRAYLLHQGEMTQLTRDHSLMADMIEAGELTPEEAHVHPQRSVITRALGSDPAMQPDLYEINVSSGDRILLCSDGLTTMLRDSRIEALLKRISDPQRAANGLVNEAIAAGGYDNITVVVIDVAGNEEERVRKVRRHGRAWAVAFMIALVAIIGGITGGAYTYVSNMAYLKAENGYVAVYRGIDGDIFGGRLSTLDHVTTVPVADLQPGVANRLESGTIACDNIEQANGLVADYEQQIRASSASAAATSKHSGLSGSR